MKIVLACDTFAPDINGAARFAERLAGGLVRNGHEVHIIAAAFDDTEGPRIENHDGVNMIVHRLRSHRVPQHKSLRWTEPHCIFSHICWLVDLPILRPGSLEFESLQPIT